MNHSPGTAAERREYFAARATGKRAQDATPGQHTDQGRRDGMTTQSTSSTGEPPNLTGSAPTGEAAVAVSLKGISKVFPGTRALDRVDLDIQHGEAHGFCGGNGSGKSTLIKILSGVLQADEGTIRIGDHELDASQIRHQAAYDLGVRVVHQDLGMFPDLSIAENMMLGSAYPMSFPTGIRWRETKRRAQAQLDRLGIAWNPLTLVRDLPIATRTQVAIARALQDVASDQGVIILDEPTAALPAHEVDILLDAIRQLAASGHAVLFVSHRLNEVMSLTDRVTVLRDGRVFAEHRTSELTETELIKAIIGREIESTGAQQSSAGTGHSVLSISGLRAGPLHDINLDVRTGEVVGVAGLLGSGRSELLRAVYGDLAKTAGTVTVNGRPADFTRMDQAIGAGVVMIQEDRPSEGVFADLTVDENMDISILDRYWGGLFRHSRMQRDSDELRKRFAVKAPHGSVAMNALSGGNQQKAILARSAAVRSGAAALGRTCPGRRRRRSRRHLHGSSQGSRQWRRGPRRRVRFRGTGASRRPGDSAQERADRRPRPARRTERVPADRADLRGE